VLIGEGLAATPARNGDFQELDGGSSGRGLHVPICEFSHYWLTVRRQEAVVVSFWRWRDYTQFNRIGEC
jgi:hypothetical protein